jgi:hypothetical protein
MLHLSTAVALASALATMPAAVPAPSQAAGDSVATTSASTICAKPAQPTHIEAAGHNVKADDRDATSRAESEIRFINSLAP